MTFGEITSLGDVWLYWEAIGEREASELLLGDGGQRDSGCDVPMFRYVGKVMWLQIECCFCSFNVLVKF